jgi:hypothetical protein
MQFNAEDEDSECLMGLGARISVDRRQVKSIISLLMASPSHAPLMDTVCFVKPCQFLDDYAFKNLMCILARRREVKHMIFFGNVLTFRQIGMLFEGFQDRPLDTLTFRYQNIKACDLPIQAAKAFHFLPLAIKNKFVWDGYGIDPAIIENILIGIYEGSRIHPIHNLEVEMCISEDKLPQLVKTFTKTNVLTRLVMDEVDPGDCMCSCPLPFPVNSRLNHVEISLASVCRSNCINEFAKQIMQSNVTSLVVKCNDLDRGSNQPYQSCFNQLLFQTFGRTASHIKRVSFLIDDEVLDLKNLMQIIRRKSSMESFSLTLFGFSYRVLTQIINAISRSTSIRHLELILYGRSRIDEIESNDRNERDRKAFLNAFEEYLELQTIPEYEPKLHGLLLDHDSSNFSLVNGLLTKYLGDMTALRYLKVDVDPRKPPILLDSIRQNKSLWKFELTGSQNAEASRRLDRDLDCQTFLSNFRTKARACVASNRVNDLLSASLGVYSHGLASFSRRRERDAVYTCFQNLIGRCGGVQLVDTIRLHGIDSNILSFRKKPAKRKRFHG